MILNETYYRKLLDKFNEVQHQENDFSSKTIALTIKIILKHYYECKPLHINFQNSKESLLEIVRYLYVEFANDIYKNHYDLPENYSVGNKLKRIKDNQYYEIIRIKNHEYTIRHISRKRKTDFSPMILTGINYEGLIKNYVRLNDGTGISEKTIKNYFDFFENMNLEKSDFPRLNFDRKIAFISKKPLWDSLDLKSKIPSIYLPNPREENQLSETKSIPALTDCIVYFTPKYEVCYQKVLLQNKTLKSIVVFDTEATSIDQILLDKQRFGFNLIILSSSLMPKKNTSIPCWNWFKEEVELVNKL